MRAITTASPGCRQGLARLIGLQGSEAQVGLGCSRLRTTNLWTWLPPTFSLHRRRPAHLHLSCTDPMPLSPITDCVMRVMKPRSAHRSWCLPFCARPCGVQSIVRTQWWLPQTCLVLNSSQKLCRLW